MSIKKIFNLYHLIIVALLVAAMGMFDVSSAAVYLDGSATGCTSGARTYSPATRSCGSGTDTVYLGLTAFASNLVPGATNYMRAGNYFVDSGSNSLGSLHIPSTKSGTATSPTVIKAFPGEELKVAVGTAKRGATYNSNPGDTTGAGSWSYYPNPAIETYDANYVVIDGLKTYGMVYLLGGHDVTVQNSDLGGGGGSGTITSDQGNTIRFNYIYNATLKNNLIHHNSRRVESNVGSLIIGYAFTALIDHNTLYDGYGTYFEDKDGLGQTGRKTEVSYNFFGPSSISSIDTAGVRGFNQAQQTSYQYIHHNIFFNKTIGINVIGAPALDNVFYNNTFINCATDINQPSNNISGGFFKSYNNIFYHANAGQSFLRIYSLSQLLASDYNLYYTSGAWATPSGTTLASTLPGWQSYSKLDANSRAANPDFANATGNIPENFKRRTYSETFTASAYSNRAGAYATGNEVIGYVPLNKGSITPPTIKSIQITK